MNPIILVFLFSFFPHFIYCFGTPPPEWNCAASRYNDSSICDCGCVAHDPDCDLDLPTNCPSSSLGCNETNHQCQYSSSHPAEWICADEHWFDGTGCDCECGAYDPDCDDVDLDIHGCASHVSYCSPDDGHCIYETPELWTCSRFVYNASDACDCNCGAYDPDCDDLSLELEGCGPSGASCSITGHCIFHDTPPTEWICEDSWYGQDQWCDCACGSYDPDCEDHSKILFNCPENYDWCSLTGHCIEDELHLWSCSENLYDDGLVCNCNCGKYDPDCDDPNNPILGCPSSAIGCDVSGNCMYPVPDDWFCSNAYYNAGDGCDCECGSFDPDCNTSISLNELYGCGPYAVGCDGHGSCIYDSNFSGSSFYAVILGLAIAITPPSIVLCLVCCCLICIFLVPACLNVIIVCIFREARKRKKKGKKKTPKDEKYQKFNDEDEEENEFDNDKDIDFNQLDDDEDNEHLGEIEELRSQNLNDQNFKIEGSFNQNSDFKQFDQVNEDINNNNNNDNKQNINPDFNQKSFNENNDNIDGVEKEIIMSSSLKEKNNFNNNNDDDGDVVINRNVLFEKKKKKEEENNENDENIF